MSWQIAFVIPAFCHAAGVGTVALVAGLLIATGRQMSHFEFYIMKIVGRVQLLIKTIKTNEDIQLMLLILKCVVL